MDKFQLINGTSWLSDDVNWHARAELRDVLNHLTDLGWDQVSWGTRDTDQAVSRFASLVREHDHQRYNFASYGVDLPTQKVSYVAVSGADQVMWLEETAPSVLEAARRCLDRARVMHRCPHTEMHASRGCMVCAACGYRRDKTAKEILSGMFLRGHGTWELILSRVEGQTYATTLLVDGVETADTAKTLVILNARKLGLDFVVSDQGKTVEQSRLFTYETITRKGTYHVMKMAAGETRRSQASAAS